MTSSSLLLLLSLAWSDGWWSTLSDNLNGSLTLGAFHHFETFEAEEHDTRLDGKLRLEFSGSLGSNVDYVLTPRVYADNMSFSSGTIDEEPDLAYKRHIVDLEEAYITFASDNVDLRIGRQRFSWGKADVYNPMNNLNPQDLIDVPTAEKMGVTSVAFNYFGPDLSLEMVVVPWFTPSRLAGANNRWLGDLDEARAQFSPLVIVPGERILEPNTIDQTQAAMRLATSSLVPGWDLALSYYDGVDPIGVVQGFLDTPFVHVNQVFPHYREIGAAFSTVRGSFEFHGEAGAHYTDGTEKDDDYLEYVLGFNYTLYPSFLEEVFIVMEYANETILDAKTPDNQYSGSGEYVRPFKGSWLASFQFKISEETNFKLRGGINQADHDGLGRAEFSHKFNDVIRLDLGFDMVNGPADSFFGRWRDNDRAWLNLVIYL